MGKANVRWLSLDECLSESRVTLLPASLWLHWLLFFLSYNLLGTYHICQAVSIHCLISVSYQPYKKGTVLQTVFKRYNWYIINYTYLKCKLDEHWYVCAHEIISTIKIINISSSPKVSLSLLASLPFSPSLTFYPLSKQLLICFQSWEISMHFLEFCINRIIWHIFFVV
jgi:hypothetical protein